MAKSKKAAAADLAPSEVIRIAEFTGEAMRFTADVMDALDEAPPEKFELVAQEFERTLTSLGDKVDHFGAVRKAFLERALDLRIRAGRAEKFAGTLEKMIARADAALIAFKNENPNMPLEGKAFTIKVAKNGGVAGLKIRLARDDGSMITPFKRSVADILDPETLMDFDIPDEFIEVVTFNRLNTKAIREYLDAGNELTWATLERGEHINSKEK
jgi:hypothetical protein